MRRLEFDLSKVAINQKQLYTHMVAEGKGRIVFVVTRTPCPKASISDQEAAPLDHLQTYIGTLKEYVSLYCLFPPSYHSRSVLASSSFSYSLNHCMFCGQSLKNTPTNLQDVGYLQVKVLRATDLPSTDLNGTDLI